MPSELKIALPAEELEELKKNTHLGGKIAAAARAFLEKYFGARILLEVPTGLQGMEPKLFPAMETAEKLQALGAIKQIDKRPKFPDEPFVHYFRITTQKTSNTGTGVDFFNEENALWKAIGEATERDLWATDNQTLRNILHLPCEKVAGSALDIFKLAGFSEEQKKQDPRLQFDSKTLFGWTTAVSLTSQYKNKSIFCPAQLINSHYFRENTAAFGKGSEPILRRCITTGLATGNSLEEAIAKGILEVIERDAYIISYLNRLSPPIIDFENLSYQDEELEKIYKSFKRYNLEIHLVKLPTDFPVQVVSAIIIDRSGQGPAWVVGHSAKFDLKSAVIGAAAEALAIRLSLKRDWDKKKNKVLPEKNRFEQTDRMIYWAKMENFEKLAFMTAGEKIQIDLAEEENFFASNEKIKDHNYYQEKLEQLVDELKEKSYEACYVELSGKNIQKLGLRCVQIAIPEMQPIHLEEETPCFGGKRLQEIPKKLGYEPAKETTREPHPFG